MFTHKEGVCVCLFTSPFILGHNRQLTVQEKERNLGFNPCFCQFFGGGYYWSLRYVSVLTVYLNNSHVLSKLTNWTLGCVCVCVLCIYVCVVFHGSMQVRQFSLYDGLPL